MVDNRLRFNGAIYQEDWDDFQFSFLGDNGLTEIRNAGKARIQGIEIDLQLGSQRPIHAVDLAVMARFADHRRPSSRKTSVNRMDPA